MEDDPKMSHMRTHSKALLTKAEIRKHFLPMGERTLDRLIAGGKFLQPDKSIGAKIRLWRVDTVLRWIDAPGDSSSAAA